MATKVLHIAAICFAVLGAVLLVVAMASSSWMIGCLKISNMINGIKEIAGASDTSVTELEEAGKVLQGASLCIQQGLYKLSMNYAGLVHVSVGIGFEALPKTVIFGGVAMAGAILCSVAASVALLMATAGTSESYQHKNNVVSRTRVGMILLIAAGLGGIAGMACYTSGTAEMVHNPLLFFAHMGRSAASSFQNVLGNSGMSRGKRDLTVPDEDMMSAVNSMLQGMDPNYGYAFALGWVAAVVLIVAAVLSALAQQHVIGQPYNGPDRSMKL